MSQLLGYQINAINKCFRRSNLLLLLDIGCIHELHIDLTPSLLCASFNNTFAVYFFRNRTTALYDSSMKYFRVLCTLCMHTPIFDQNLKFCMTVWYALQTEFDIKTWYVSRKLKKPWNLTKITNKNVPWMKVTIRYLIIILRRIVISLDSNIFRNQIEYRRQLVHCRSVSPPYHLPFDFICVNRSRFVSYVQNLDSRKVRFCGVWWRSWVALNS
jgi:hypothetical protein